MKKTITINTDDPQNITVSVVIESLPINSIKALKNLPRQIVEAYGDTIAIYNGSDLGEELKEAIRSNLLGTE